MPARNPPCFAAHPLGRAHGLPRLGQCGPLEILLTAS
jgi:hypothetical protein